MVPLFEHLLCHHLSFWTCYFLFKLNEALLPRKSSRAPAAFKVRSSLWYGHKLPDAFEQLSLYSIKLCISITTSMYLALSICVLFILLMQLVNGAQFLNTTYISLFPLPFANASTVIVPLTRIHTSLYSHKLDLNIEVLNLYWLPVLNLPRELSAVSTQSFVLNLVGWFGVLSIVYCLNLLLFCVPLL